MNTFSENNDYFALHPNKLISKSQSVLLPNSCKLLPKRVSLPSTRSRHNSLKQNQTDLLFKNFSFSRKNSASDWTEENSRMWFLKKHSKKSLSRIIDCVLRNLEQDQNLESRIKACKSIRKWVKLAPKSFPRAFCAALVALSESDSDDLQEFAQEILRLLSIKNCEVLVACGGLQVLLKKVLDPKTPIGLSENIVLTLTFLLNEANTRQYFNNGREILKIFAVFTHCDSGIKDSDQAILLKNARKVLVLMMRSWTGLIYLTNNGLGSLIRSLTQPGKNIIKEEILDMLLEILNIQTNTTCFSFSLINNYLAIVVKALVNCGVVGEIVNLAVKSSQGLRVKAKRLLRIILKAATDLLPDPPVLPFEFNGEKFKLVSELTVFNEEKSLNRKNFLAESVKFVNFDEKMYSGMQKNSIFNPFFSSKINELVLLELIHSSKVHKKVKKWKWDLIYQLVSVHLHSDEYFVLFESQKFLATVLTFFLPSKNFFHSLPWHKDQFIKAKTGRLLISLLLSKPAGSSILTSFADANLVQSHKSFMNELYDCIEEEIVYSKTKNDNSYRILTPDIIQSCMAREYFLFIGIFLNSEQGKTLLKSHKVYKKIQELHGVEHLAALILPLLDYKKTEWKNFLELSLQGSLKLKFKVLELVKSLFKIKISDFSWIIGGLKGLLSSKVSLLVNTTLKLLDELCENLINLEALIETRPQELFFLGDLGKVVIFHFCRLPQGVKYLQENWFLDKELEAWDRRLNAQYAKMVEEKIEMKIDPPKVMFSLILQAPKECESLSRIDWINKLPFLICVVTSTGRKYEFSPLIFYFPGIIEIFISLDTNLFLYERLGAGLMLGMSHIDVFGNECQEDSLTWCNKDSLDEFLCFEKSGIRFEFTNPSKPKLSSISFKVKILSKHLPGLDMPVHLFAALSQTSAGIKILKNSGYISEYCSKLNKKVPILNKRAYLWALGCTGSTDIGTELLLKTDAVSLMVNIAENSPTLSLRGTAFQALSLISRNKVGKRVLNDLGWVCNEANQASIMLPSNPNCIFFIEKNQEFLPFLQKVKKTENVLKKIKLWSAETEAFELICKLGSVLHKNKSENALKILKTDNPGVFLSRNLYKSVMEVLSTYRFGLQTRLFIHKLFDLMPQGPLVEFELYYSIL